MLTASPVLALKVSQSLRICLWHFPMYCPSARAQHECQRASLYVVWVLEDIWVVFQCTHGRSQAQHLLPSLVTPYFNIQKGGSYLCMKTHLFPSLSGQTILKSASYFAILSVSSFFTHPPVLTLLLCSTNPTPRVQKSLFWKFEDSGGNYSTEQKNFLPLTQDYWCREYFLVKVCS